MSNAIVNPLYRHQQVIIPAGTPVRSMNPRHTGLRVTKRAQTIVVFSKHDGWIDTMNANDQGRGYVILPVITWPGAGGYWQDVQVTADLLAANGMSPLVMPELTTYERGRLDVEPSFDEGYTNQWKVPATV